MNFHSSEYQWLVVAGAKAQFKGTGTINGSYGSANTSGYGFILTAIDGKLNGGGEEIDKFRVKIWDKDASDVTTYDNNADTELDGGSIVIHEAK